MHLTLIVVTFFGGSTLFIEFSSSFFSSSFLSSFVSAFFSSNGSLILFWSSSNFEMNSFVCSISKNFNFNAVLISFSSFTVKTLLTNRTGIGLLERSIEVTSLRILPWYRIFNPPSFRKTNIAVILLVTAF